MGVTDGRLARSAGCDEQVTERSEAMRPIQYSTAPLRLSSDVGRFEVASRSTGRLRRQRLAPTGAGRVRHGLGGRR